MNILVTDGENRSALAVTRSLGRRGCSVYVSGKELGNISSSSKFCRGAFKTPDPLTEAWNYSKSIAEIVNKENIDMIFPMTEQSVYCLNDTRELLENRVILACAPSDKMEAMSNKYKLFQLAERFDVAIPETIYVMSADDYTLIKPCIQKFPVVVKPALSKIKDGDRIISTKVMYAADQDELNLLYETIPALRYPSLIQELIVGEGTGLFTLFDRDRHLALFSHRRLLEKPPMGGVSVLSESVPLDEEMVSSSRKLLSEVNWQGIAMVEFKRDIRDGRAKLIEINGRFWGSLQLAVSSGVDFPTLCLEYFIDGKPAPLLSDYRVGHRLKWFYGILDHMLIRLRNGENSHALPKGTLTRWHAIKELLNIGDNNTSSDVYDPNDLRPVILETKAYIKNIISSRL